MNDLEYCLGAVRTEAPVTEELTGRITPGAVSAVIELLGDAVSGGKDLDALKKYIFYGKETSDLLIDESVSVLDLPSGALERLRQPEIVRILHGVLGLVTEVAEMAGPLLEHVQSGKPIDHVNLGEELGDLFWYMAILASAIGDNFPAIKARNNAKLRFRFPAKFEEAQAVTRDLVGERNVLEKPNWAGNTKNGRTARVTCIDRAKGYIYGNIDGILDLQVRIGGLASDPAPLREQTWGYPDGAILTEGDSGLSLDLNSFGM